MKQKFKNIEGKILITGGTGSWGNELCKQLLTLPKVERIIIFSRNEHKQVEMQREFNNDKLKFVIGDVRDKDSLKRVVKGAKIVFHLAALKHVPVCEENAWEVVKTNIIGTQNLVSSAIEAEVEYVVDVSTDKAVEPHNIYGMSKACGEKIVTTAQHNYESNTKFVCIRAGNVMGTNGSVLPLFKNQIEQSNKITVTDPEMTRFLMKTKEAIFLVFEAVSMARGGETYVMKMPSMRVDQIANAMIEKYGNSKTSIEFIGTRPGEKKHEVLVSNVEVNKTYELNDNYFVILPDYGEDSFLDIKTNYKLTELNSFSSDKALNLKKEDFLNQIKDEDWA